MSATLVAGLALVLALGPRFGSQAPPACDDAPIGQRFCASLPSFDPPPPASSNAAALVDQIQPCQSTGFRPSFCVGLAAPGATVDRPALVAQRRATCEQLGREAPDFCVSVPAADTANATLQREVALALVRQRLGADFARVGSGRTQLWAEVGLAGAIADHVERLVLEDAAAVETFFGRTFREPPAVFLFRSRQSFAAAMERQFGVPADVAAQLAGELLGVLITGADAVAINGESVLNGGRPVVYRHELGHVLIHQLAGDRLPSWLDEGLAAYVSDFDASIVSPERAIAMSMLRVDPQAVGMFTDPRAFLDINAELSGHAYAVAAEAVHAIDLRAGRSGVVALLEALARGTPI
ncbi:MAG: Peptidase superfamily, partial [Chloroflexota bacterium]|nr:Peptidase superfamily [Chloroflexota bacterium]